MKRFLNLGFSFEALDQGFTIRDYPLFTNPNIKMIRFLRRLIENGKGIFFSEA